MDLSIIIVNYNVKEFLQNLIHSIHKASSNLKTEIIIIDNASDDGSVEFISEKFPEISIIANKKNVGFSKANNQGLALASGKYFLLLNPDTLVREDTFEKMISFFEKTPEAGLAGCKILNPDGTLQLACRRSFPGPWTSFCKVTGLSSLFPKSKFFARYNLTYLDENQTYEVDAISGSFMMMRNEVYKKTGGFDEQFFMYGEDLDFCYRVQKSGYKVYYFHETQIIHYKGESTKRSSIDETKIFYQAMHLFVKKHFSASFLAVVILRTAIILREFFAFVGRRKLIFISVILDFIFFNISLFIAEKIYTSLRGWLGFPDYGLPYVYTIPAFIHIISASFLGVYKRDSLSVLRNFSAIIIGFFLLSSITYFFKDFAYSRAVIIITYLLLFFSLTLWRVIAKVIFKAGLQEIFKSKRSLIVGTEKNALEIAKKLQAKHTDLHSVVGLISVSHKEIGNNIDGFEVAGSIENINKVITGNNINEVIFTSGELSYNQMMSIVSVCRKENTEFKIVGNNLDFLVGKTSVSVLNDIPLIELRYNITSPTLKFIKNMFDYSLAAFVLFFIYPSIYFIIRLNKKKSEFKEFVLNVPKIFSEGYSFVGPKEKSKNEKLFLGKKGLTGLWYTEEAGSDLEKLDIYYAKNQNIWLDIEILGKTINKMWRKKS